MIRVFRLPDLGEGLTESEIVAWRVAPGDTVELNQLIADVETAKAVVELPSPFAGVVTELHQEPGTVVHVGEPIVSFEVAGTDTPDHEVVGRGGGETASDRPGRANAAAPAEEREAVLVGYGAAPERQGRPLRRARGGAAADPTEPVAEPVAELAATRPRSTPPVRALARVLGVDLARVTGTGPTGLITREDVQARRDLPGEPDPESGSQPARDERETRSPIRSVRKHTAAAMVRSAFTAPHVTEFLTVDVTPTMDLIESLRTNRSFQGVRIGILAVVAKALCLAIARNPSLNTRWDEAAGEIVQYHYVNLGIAAATPRGLLVPNIPGADRLGLAEVAAALAGLTETARAGTTSAESLRGGTISITNVGVFGIDAGTPILNPGEAAILAVGGIRRQPWEHRGEIALRQIMTLSLSFDHRLVDGEQGARFLVDVGTILADPAMVLTMV
jgi:2-oxoisovalerate dehydrogenase E2 component (dihydrolipoyl transacylase)